MRPPVSGPDSSLQFPSPGLDSPDPMETLYGVFVSAVCRICRQRFGGHGPEGNSDAGETPDQGRPIEKRPGLHPRRGRRIVYTVQESPTLMSLMRLKLADGSTERLHPEATTAEFEADLHPGRPILRLYPEPRQP